LGPATSDGDYSKIVGRLFIQGDEYIFPLAWVDDGGRLIDECDDD
jgi:hypothetical protein